MKGFVRSRGLFVAEFLPEEARMLSSLASQVAELVRDPDAQGSDPAVRRLLPDAYPHDAEASAEFRRFTVDGLAERKAANAGQVVADLAGAAGGTSASKVRLTDASTAAWLRSLTDIRLTVATRLGITEDDDLGSEDPELLDLYNWLGFVQGSLVDCLARR
jgi:hypothetical protein